MVLVIAVVVDVAVWLIASAAGVDFEVAFPGQDPREVTLVSVLLAVSVFGGLGWAARAVLDRIAKDRAATIWLIGAAVVLLVSLLPQLAIEATTGARSTLILMHLMVAASLFPVMGRKRPNAQA